MTDIARAPFDGTRLPTAPRLASLGVFGATAAFTALAIGSGELMFWPALVVTSGAGVIWIAILIILMQWFVNIEVARYSLATGETIGVGLGRRAPIIAFLLFLGALVPWIWPGWIRAGGQMISAISGLNEKPISLLLLVLCALFILMPKSAYLFLEKIQAWMLAMILLGIVWLFSYVALSAGGLGAFFGEVFRFQGTEAAAIRFANNDNATYFALLSGVVFAGAGGILNLGYGYLVLARNRARPADIELNLTVDEALLSRWQRWIKVLRIEHGILFAGGNIASVVFLSALFFMLYQNSGTNVSGVDLLASTYSEIAQRYGLANAIIFGVVGFLVFFTSSVGILDLTCRIAADIFSALFRKAYLGGYSVFAVLVFSQSVLSAALIFIDTRQPFWLISTAAVLNTLVMALYAFAVVWLNRTTLDRRVRAPLGAELVVLLLGTMYGLVFVLTIARLAS